MVVYWLWWVACIAECSYITRRWWTSQDVHVFCFVFVFSSCDFSPFSWILNSSLQSLVYPVKPSDDLHVFLWKLDVMLTVVVSEKVPMILRAHQLCTVMFCMLFPVKKREKNVFILLSCAWAAVTFRSKSRFPLAPSPCVSSVVHMC